MICLQLSPEIPEEFLSLANSLPVVHKNIYPPTYSLFFTLNIFNMISTLLYSAVHVNLEV